MRPAKVIRLNYWKMDPEFAANISIYGEPAEVRISASKDKFLSVTEKGVSLAPGFGNSINVQAMPQKIKYAGMVSDLGFPLSLLPSTMATPFPQQKITPPFLNQVSQLREFSKVLRAVL